MDGGWVGGWVVVGWFAINLDSNHDPEYLSFSKICSERSFSSCKNFFDIFLTYGPTDRPTNLVLEAPCRSFKTEN